MALLAAIEASPAPFTYSQDEVTARVLRWIKETGVDVDPRAAERLFSRAGVVTRSSLKPLDEVFTNASFAARNAVYQEAAIRTGVSVARQVLAHAALDAVDIVVSSSCTGFMIPAVDAHIVNALGLGPRVARLPITEAGCAGGAVALARAADYVKANPKKAALVVAVEFSSLTFQTADFSATNLVATALFADGSAGAVLLGADHPGAARASTECLATASYFIPDSLGAMGYDVVESGLKLVLDKRLPDFLRERLRPMVDDFLRENGLSLEAISRFAIHPGGRKVLDVVAEELSLDPARMEPSRSVLREHGNMSSATIFFVLRRALADLASGAALLAVGFGPGFSIELSLWRGRSSGPAV